MNKYLIAVCIVAASLSYACAERTAVHTVQTAGQDRTEATHAAHDDVTENNRSFGDWLQYGKQQETEGHHEQAKDAFMQAVMLEPDSAEAHYRLGRAYRGLGNVKYALRAFEEAVRLNPDLEEGYVSLGSLYQEMGSEKQALEAYQNVVRIDPRNAGAHYNLGRLYLSMRQKKEAKEAFINAVRNKPDFAEAHYELGVVYVMFNNIAAAIEEYKILVDLDRGLAYRLFGKIYE